MQNEFITSYEVRFTINVIFLRTKSLLQFTCRDGVIAVYKTKCQQKNGKIYKAKNAAKLARYLLENFVFFCKMFYLLFDGV